MYDRGLGVLEQYGLTANTVIRGRGALICDTEQGLKIIREYWGSPAKMERQQKLQAHCQEEGFRQVDLVLSNQEGQVISKGEDGTPYIVRDWFSGRECDTRSETDIRKSVAYMAELHKVMHMDKEENPAVETLPEEMKRHNREMRKIRNFLQKKKKKNEFEETLSKSVSYFIEQGESSLEMMETLEFEKISGENATAICHGDCNQHNILMVEEAAAFTNFEHWNYGPQVADLYQFMRKILEKHSWNRELGMMMLKTYEKGRRMSDEERRYLKILLAYPWKYWKIANFYTNNNKSWISRKNLEKLNQTIELREPWKRFLEQFPE